MNTPTLRIIGVLLLLGLLLGCASVPSKRYYILNYVPTPPENRAYKSAYPFTVRLKEFEIEEAYARPQIVYRQSPFQLRYYFYRVWAVKPTRMVTDLVQKHLRSVNLVSHIVRRFDEGRMPDYELTGTIEAIEEYDSDEIWFAHISLRMRLTRLSDGKMLYSRHFDHRMQVFHNEPENVVREMSATMEYILNQAVRDLDGVFAREYGISSAPKEIKGE